jgi:hypothetical protein
MFSLCLMVCVAQCSLRSLCSLHWSRESGDSSRISLNTVVGFLVFLVNFAMHLSLVTLFRNEEWVLGFSVSFRTWRAAMGQVHRLKPALYLYWRLHQMIYRPRCAHCIVYALR